MLPPHGQAGDERCREAGAGHLLLCGWDVVANSVKGYSIGIGVVEDVGCSWVTVSRLTYRAGVDDNAALTKGHGNIVGEVLEERVPVALMAYEGKV